MNLFPISDLPLTAVVDSPDRSVPKTTPIWRKHATNPQNTRSSSSYSSGVPSNQGPAPVLLRRRWSNERIPGSRKWKVANFETLSTSTWNTRRFDFEHYPTAVIPWNMGSTTPIYSDEVDKVQVGSGDFVFFLPVLLLLGTIVVLGIILLCLKRRQKIDEIRHKLLPVYHFAPGEEEEWGVLLNDEEDLFKKPSKVQKKF